MLNLYNLLHQNILNIIPNSSNMYLFNPQIYKPKISLTKEPEEIKYEGGLADQGCFYE